MGYLTSPQLGLLLSDLLALSRYPSHAGNCSLRAAAYHTGAVGLRYHVQIESKRTFLYRDGNRWFVEATVRQWVILTVYFCTT